MTDTEDVPSTPDVSDETSELATLRRENAALLAKLEESSLAEKPSSRGWRRPWISIACAIIGAILLPVAVLTVWAKDTMLNTDDYVATVAPLVEDENIQEAISFRVTEAVAEAVDFRSIAEDALPSEAQVLAGPIDVAAKRVVTDVVGGVVATDGFGVVWRESNRLSHENIVALLTGKEGEAISTSDGRVAIRLGPLASQALDQLDEQWDTDLATKIPAEELDAEFVLVESEELADAQTVVRVFDTISWIWLILTLGFLVGAVFLAERRRLGVRRLGIAVVVSMVVTLLGYNLLRSQYLAGLSGEVHNPDAAAAVYDILTSYLVRSLRMLLVVGLLVLFGAWVVGPTEPAARVRTGWDTLLGRASETRSDRPAGPMARAAATYERGLLTGAAILGSLVLVVWSKPTALVVVSIVVVILLAMGVVRVLAEIARRSGAPPLDAVDTQLDAVDAQQSRPVDVVADEGATLAERKPTP